LRFFGSVKERAGDDLIQAPPFEGVWWRVVIRDGAVVGAVHAGPPGSSWPLWALVEKPRLAATDLEALRTGDMDALETA
jgi:hypothetical protein